MWNDSPITTVLACVLKAMVPSQVASRRHNEDQDYLVVSYHDDFSYLWEINGHARDDIIEWITSGEDRIRTIIVVWDRIPASRDTTINIADYLTPYDWGLVCSKLVFSKVVRRFGADSSQPAKFPHLRIIIIDLDSQSHPAAFAQGAFLAVGHSLPWIQMYRPTQSESDELSALKTIGNNSIAHLRTAIAPGSFGLETLFKDILSYNDDSKAARSLTLRTAQEERDRLPIIESLTSLWQSSLVRPGNRHHVGNLLGPMLLVKGMPQVLQEQVDSAIRHSDPLRNALKVLVDVIGLEGVLGNHKSALPQPGILTALSEESNVFDRRSYIKVLLIDDQFQLGYQHLLACLMFGAQYDMSKAVVANDNWSYELPNVGALECDASAEGIFQALDNLPPVDNWDEPRLFQRAESFDILVLDLRLWVTPEQRKQFLTRLLDACKRLGALEGKGENAPMANTAFKLAFEHATLAVTDGGESVSELESLVLLPLLLSHYDPSMPIILFSSTHQRSIVQMVSNRPNIITDFAKPILSGYGEEREASSLVDDLIHAMRKAVHLHEARGIWIRLLHLGWGIAPVFECFTGQRLHNERILKVYNVPASATVKSTSSWLRESGGKLEPRVNRRRLRLLLARYFTTYIQRERYFDFCSAPWEFLEGSLVPKKVLTDPNVFNPHFSMRPDLIEPEEKRNNVGRILEVIRHKKAHGNAPPATSDADTENYRVGAILEFSILLDFIEGSRTNERPMSPTIADLWERVMSRNSHLERIKRPPEPNRLTADMGVSWLDFVAYSALWYASLAVDNGIRFLKKKTVLQIERFAQKSMQQR